MKRLLWLALCVTAATPAMAQQVRMDPIAAPDQNAAIPLYPDQPAPAAGADEQWSHMHVQIGSNVIDNIMARTVVRPTLTPYLPAPGKATGGLLPQFLAWMEADGLLSARR